MKKNIMKILLTSILLLSLTGCSNELKEYKQVLEVSELKESLPSKYYKIDDDTTIYSNYDSIKYNSKELKDILQNKELSVQEITKKMILKAEANDGGSKYYQDGDVSVIVCNSFEENGNNHNIYIGYKQEDVVSVCSIDVKKIETCIDKTLTSYLTNKKTNVKKAKISSISKNKNYESFTYKKSSLGEFVLIKTDDNSLIKDIKTYFKKKNKNYYKHDFVVYSSEMYHIFFYNTKKTNPTNKVNACLNITI